MLSVRVDPEHAAGTILGDLALSTSRHDQHEQQAIDPITFVRPPALPWPVADEHSAWSVAIMSRLL